MIITKLMLNDPNRDDNGYDTIVPVPISTVGKNPRIRVHTSLDTNIDTHARILWVCKCPYPLSVFLIKINMSSIKYHIILNF